MKKLVLVLITINSLFVFSKNLNAEIIIGKKIQVQKEMRNWNVSFERLVEGKENDSTSNDYVTITECREVTELHGVHLCLSLNQENMNLALTRAGVFIEGHAGLKGKIISHDEPELLDLLEMISGHDMKGEDLISFYKAASLACKASNYNSNICLNTQEKELIEKFILPEVAKNPNFVIITYALYSNLSYVDVVTHEILHAQYFTDAIFRKVVDNFWKKEVTIKDKEKFRKILSEVQDASNDYLMMNEFQAYILQAGSENGSFDIFINKYKKLLLKSLLIEGKKPILIQW